MKRPINLLYSDDEDDDDDECSEANGDQDHSDVVGTAAPHCLTGQLLASRFKLHLLLRQPRLLLHTPLLQ